MAKTETQKAAEAQAARAVKEGRERQRAAVEEYEEKSAAAGDPTPSPEELDAAVAKRAMGALPIGQEAGYQTRMVSGTKSRAELEELTKEDLHTLDPSVPMSLTKDEMVREVAKNQRK